ncbi:hypothetical protein [Methylococcus capsulatus]|uniref:hypothetical protein n=1 Tax=Methylococcus capsulatus TaxID=414 RepID=UPI001C528DD7|nr:hypothetical protein [Methylococcus capsulatus]QXP87466.1 hypothetical protein KW112_14080 [Methylococcus capsulatus]QXP92796.1 hypothetical protein KW113_10430 [Methylococcus capsulatus]UQN12475.1 hypothetical protein M3M30_01050 [Methylococcus capsulatus]
MKRLLLTLAAAPGLALAIPATPVMTLYQFNGPLDIPYYDADAFLRNGPASPAGTLSQGSSVIPCLVLKNGQPLTDATGTPYVGFKLVVDSRTATPPSAEKFKQAVAERKTLVVANHHCDASVRHVIDVRKLYPMEKAPFFDPPREPVRRPVRPDQGELDRIVKAFHDSPQCESANGSLTGRRSALARAWDQFARANPGHWPARALEQAKQLDYVMRTALFEGHLERGCNAYGACERNVIALSIRNRGKEGCSSGQGCGAPGDFQGVASRPSQYNIWDEYLTQVTGLTACFLRQDLSQTERYAKLQAMYAQTLPDVQRILFGDDADLREIFPFVPLTDLKSLKHYYHAPAMGKCFPGHERAEYIAGAVARKGRDFALIANTRIQVEDRADGGYFFRDFLVTAKDDRDEVRIVDNYPGFVIDARKVDLKPTARCLPYGIPAGCEFGEPGRYRTTPVWLNTGRPLELRCHLEDRGENCQAPPVAKTVGVGGRCDTQMRPVAGVK